MDLNTLINNRYSIRDFQPEKLTEEVLKEVLEAGRMAPSAVNYQPWIFIVVNEEALLKKLQSSYPRSWFASAPQVIVVCADHQQSWKRANDQKDHADIDVAITTDHMTLKATELGLGTCWVCNFDPEGVAKTLGLPQHIEPVVLLPIGRPASPSVPQKKRKPLESIIRFNGY